MVKKTMKIKIGKNEVGDGCPTYIILEIARTYNNDLAEAKKMMEIAAATGADAIKIQTIVQKELMVENPYTKDYCRYLKTLERSEREHRYLQKEAKKLGLEFLSTPEGFSGVDLLEKIGVNAYKISSLNLVYHKFLSYIASKEKPVILSTGMGTMDEIEKAIEVIKETGNDKIILLHCVSLYPPRPNQLNLKAIGVLKEKLGVITGFSDHSIGITAPLGAVALGAKVIEKHYSLDRAQEGADHFVSVSPTELVQMVRGIRRLEKMLGRKGKKLLREEREMREEKRRKIVPVKNLRKRSIIKEEFLVCKQLRSIDGIDCKYLEDIVGKRLLKSLKKDEPLEWKYISRR